MSMKTERDTIRERERERGGGGGGREGEKASHACLHSFIFKFFQQLTFTIHFFAYIRPFLLRSNAIDMQFIAVVPDNWAFKNDR